MTSTATHDRFADYVPVSERLEHFYKDHPDGRVLTSIVEHDAENGFVLIRAEIYRERDDAAPSATGHAFENRSEGYVNKTSYIENCETSATGRALALLGYEIRRGIASREEMQKTERMGSNGDKEDAACRPYCPECKESKAVIRGKAEYGGGWLCFKKKGGCGAKWQTEGITEGYSEDQILRDQYFAQAEKLMSGLEESKRKDALGRLLMLSTEDMGKKVLELAENARKKRQLDGGTQAGHMEDERQQMLVKIQDEIDEKQLVSYMSEHYEGMHLSELSLEALTKLYSDLEIPF